MLETGLFFLLSWSAFLSAEAASLTGQCFILHCKLAVWMCVYAPGCTPPWLSRKWDGVSLIWVCVRISLSWVLGGEKNNNIHFVYNSFTESLQNIISSSLLAGRVGVGEQKLVLKSTNDSSIEMMDDSTNGNLYSECEGTHNCFVEKGGFLHLGLTACIHVSSLSRVCTSPHTSGFNIWLYSLAGQKTKLMWRLCSLISLSIESLYIESSEEEQLIEKGAVPKVLRAMDSVIWIWQLDCVSATGRVCAWVATTIGCFSK